MSELLYVSQAKVDRWAVRAAGATWSGELGVGLAKVGLSSAKADEASTKAVSRQLSRICREIERTPSFSRWVPDASAPAASWFAFETRLRWGKIGRGVAEGPRARLHNMVFFGGPAPHDAPVCDLLLGGWAGHLIGERAAHDPSGRMGSRLDDFFDLWSEISQDEQKGLFAMYPRLLRIRREKSRGDTITLEQAFRWAYGTFDHALKHYPEISLRGYAQVLATLPQGGYARPMVIGTPLFVEMNYT